MFVLTRAVEISKGRKNYTVPCCLWTWEFSLILEEEHSWEVLRTETWGLYLFASESNKILGTSYPTNCLADWRTDRQTDWLTDYLITWFFLKNSSFQDIPSILRKPSVYYRVRYAELHESSLRLPILPMYLRFISILSFHLRVGLRSSLFIPGCRVKHAFTSVLPILPHDAPISSSFISLPKYYLMRSTSHEASRSAVFSVSCYFFLLRAKYFFLWKPYSQASSACVLC
jgi:hypothetical protein